MKEIAIFGLAGDPIHIEHVKLAELISETCDEVWLMPCYEHLAEKTMEAGGHRLIMCSKAIAGLPKLKLCQFEIVFQCSGSTLETLRLMVQYYESVSEEKMNFSFVIGQDNAENINKWKNNKTLINEFPFIVVSRFGVVSKQSWYLKAPHKFIQLPSIVEISSTMIRDGLKNDPESVRAFLHPDVFEYIMEAKIYGCGSPN